MIGDRKSTPLALPASLLVLSLTVDLVPPPLRTGSCGGRRVCNPGEASALVRRLFFSLDTLVIPSPLSLVAERLALFSSFISLKWSLPLLASCLLALRTYSIGMLIKILVGIRLTRVSRHINAYSQGCGPKANELVSGLIYHSSQHYSLIKTHKHQQCQYQEVANKEDAAAAAVAEDAIWAEEDAEVGGDARLAGDRRCNSNAVKCLKSDCCISSSTCYSAVSIIWITIVASIHLGLWDGALLTMNRGERI
jgi:hypothetical protein